MYDDLINLLRRCGKQKCKNCEYEHVLGCVTKMNEKAADAIEQLSNAGSAYGRGWTLGYDAGREESKPRWIPVTERLPETPGEYMVAYHPCYWDRVHDEIKVGLDSFRGKTSWAKKKYQRVTHWMPLPEPPKEESNGV